MSKNTEITKRRAVLLLCHFYPGAAGTIIDHIHAFDNFSENEYFILSNLGNFPQWLDLSRFDAVILHYSLIACNDNYISPISRKRIRDFRGFKAAFVQDDYRFINETITALSYMRIHALFPLTNPNIMDAVYGTQRLAHIRKETVLAGYVPEHLIQLDVKPYSERSYDVIYRARALPAWMGSHTIQKWQIADRFLKDAPYYNLNVDISCREEDRVYGDSWIKFVTDSRATLGTESGASICDFTGKIQRNVEAHLEKYPDSDFDMLQDLYFKNEDRNIMMNVISPRCFESAALRTLMILYEGEYSGVLVPWHHYVPLKLDHSNMHEVVNIIRSPEKAQKIIDQAYNEIARNEKYSYANMVKLVDRVMNEEWLSSFLPACNRFNKSEFSWLSNSLSPTSTDFSSSNNHVISQWVPIPQHTKIENPFYIKLDTEIEITSLAIRWDIDNYETPNSFQLQLMNHNKMMKNEDITPQKMDLPFQIINFHENPEKVNAIKISLPNTELLPAQPLSLIIIGKVATKPLKQLVFWNTTIKKIWILIPETIKRILRPTIHWTLNKIFIK